MTCRPAARPARPAGIARFALPAALACATACGCAGLRETWDRAVASDVARPAVPAAPPRIAGATVSPDDDPADRVALASAGGGGEVKTADAFAPAGGPAAAPAAVPRFDDADVVATVNGEPILAGDLLQFEGKLAAAADWIENAPNTLEDPERGFSPGQREQMRIQLDAARHALLVERLPSKIEEALLAQRMIRTLDKDQLEQLDAMVADVFAQTMLPRMLEQSKAKTRAELEREMAAQGMTLQAVIDAWKPQEMAMGYVQQNTPVGSIRVSRGEVREYYETHLAEFTPPKAARWSQIEVPYASPGEKSAALDVIEVAAADLKRGRPFAEVAEDYSRGPKAADGGRWDWTKPDSLADAPADAALWAQPVGEIGPPVDCPRGGGGVLKLILVTERRGDAAPPLEELRDRIEAVLKDEKKQRSIAALLAEERAAAQVEVFVPGAVWPPAP